MPLFFLFLTAALPFAAKIGVMLLGLQGYALQSLYKIFQLCIPIGWRYKQHKRGLELFWPIHEPLPSRHTWIIATALSILLSGGAISIVYLVALVWHIDPAMLREGFDQRFSVSGTTAVLVVFFLSFINSALEELHFRAWLDRELSQKIGNIGGITISAAAFAGMHGLIFWGLPGFPSSLIALPILGLFICGVCWSMLSRKLGGIHAAWWSHGLADALLLSWGLYWLGYI